MEVKVSYETHTISYYNYSIIESDEPTISLEPSLNAQYEGNSAVFNCTSYRYDYILWTMNDDPVTIDYLDLKPVNIFDKENLMVYSKLTVPGSLVYNNSRIACTGVSLSRNTNQASNNGFLFVQGTYHYRIYNPIITMLAYNYNNRIII